MFFKRCFPFSLFRRTSGVIPAEHPVTNTANKSRTLPQDQLLNVQEARSQVVNFDSYGAQDRLIFSKLASINIETAPKPFTMNGRELWCKVISVYDGDTVNLVFLDGPGLLKHYRLRLYGVDTPEMKPPKNAENRANIIESAKNAREFLAEKVENKIVFVRFKAEEKYGRLMGDIYLSNQPYEQSVNSMLIESGHALPYFGGSKLSA